MKTILVSLISEQTVPNVIIADHFKPDIYWFITTEKMEKEQKTWCIENVLKLKGHNLSESNVKKEIVDQDSLTDCIEKIEQMVDLGEDEVRYIVNITGGNKIMALGAFEVFTNVGQRVSIGYMPLGKKEFIQVYPRKKPFKVVPIQENLNLKEYFASYGFTIQNEKKLKETIKHAHKREKISGWILNNYEKLRGMLGFLYKLLGNKRSEKQVIFSEAFNRHLSDVEHAFLSKLSFQCDDLTISKVLTRDEICYVTGGWLEERVFSIINELVKEKILNDVLMGVQLKSIYGSDSELDIAFMKDNSFYHIECKTLGDKKEQNIVRDEIYKKGAISTLLGKGSKQAIICTTFDELKENLINRARDYDVEILSLQEVRNLKERLTSRFKTPYETNDN